MDQLFRGIREFRVKDFEEHRELFRELGRKQAPHSLFVTCTDSRIDPTLITKALPGELFVIRNIANLVPPYRQSSEYLSTTSAVEYAVQILNVENIVICGHSNCGGCACLHKESAELALTPHTNRWLDLARPILGRVERELGPEPDPERREWLTEQLNIVEQMNHLLTYPFVRERWASGTLKIMGWYYIIETGEIFNYDDAAGTFLKVE